MKKQRAYCIRCDAEGPLAEPCASPVCRKEGYAFIPSDYYVPLKDKPKAVVDPRIGRQFDDFLLVKRLSRSPFGRVYLGLQRPVMMKAAVKVLDPSTGGEVDEQALIDRFRNEASALGNLNHPNIVRLLKYGGEFEPPYLAMEYVEGVRTLAEELEAIHKTGKRTLPPASVRDILCQILWALTAAHERGIVHLDLRPENIALQDSVGYENFVRLLDFGLAAYLDRVNEEELAMGTAEYIAPERIVMGQTGPTTDLYSVGVLAFDLLAGRSLFRELTLDKVVEHKQDPDFKPGSLLNTNRFPPFVVSFFNKALAFEPEDRYGSAEEFLTRLKPVISFFEE